MGTTHIPEPDPTRAQQVGAKVQDLIDSGHELYAAGVTGDRQGRVRRPTLFIIAMVGTALGAVFFPAAVVGIIAILLLALTDNVVEL